VPKTRERKPRKLSSSSGGNTSSEIITPPPSPEPFKIKNKSSKLKKLPYNKRETEAGTSNLTANTEANTECDGDIINGMAQDQAENGKLKIFCHVCTIINVYTSF